MNNEYYFSVILESSFTRKVHYYKCAHARAFDVPKQSRGKPEGIPTI